MSAAIDSFVTTHLRLAPGKTAKTTDVVSAYTAFNKGSTGKLKLYARVQAMDGVKKVRQTFTGIELIEFVNIATEEKDHESKTQKTENAAVILIDGKTPDMIRLEIDLRRIALEERKAALKAMKAKDAKEMEERKEERKAALEAMKAMDAKEIESMKAKDAAALEATKAKDAKEIEAMRVALADRLKEKDAKLAKELKEMDAAEKVRDREFWAEQNNKK
jgi:hypothetical protein